MDAFPAQLAAKLESAHAGKHQIEHNQVGFALLRRSQPGPDGAADLPDELRFGEVEIDFRSYEARRNGAAVQMTRKEFAILRYLASRAGEVLSRDDLLNQVWGYDAYPSSRTVDNHVAGLRAKLERDASLPEHIRTVHGVGYKFVP